MGLILRLFKFFSLFFTGSLKGSLRGFVSCSAAGRVWVSSPPSSLVSSPVWEIEGGLFRAGGVSVPEPWAADE